MNSILICHVIQIVRWTFYLPKKKFSMESSPGIEKLKNGKACGLDGILNKFIKAGSELLLTMITQLFHSIWLTDLFPEKWSLGIINPIQAGLFCYHIGWEGHIVPPPPFLLYLLSNCNQTWHDSSLGQHLSKTVKVKSIMTSHWRLWCHLCSNEHWKLLRTVYFKIGAASSSFIWSFSNLAETFNINTALDWKSWIWNNRRFPCSDDVINIMLAFLTNIVPFFCYFSKILLCWHKLWKSML